LLRNLLELDHPLITTNYVLLETIALAQRRFGADAVSWAANELFPCLRTEWISETDHEAGVAAVLAARRRDLSLVDCVSFEIMRRLGLRRCFSFDPHFAEMGFECLR